MIHFSCEQTSGRVKWESIAHSLLVSCSCPTLRGRFWSRTRNLLLDPNQVWRKVSPWKRQRPDSWLFLITQLQSPPPDWTSVTRRHFWPGRPPGCWSRPWWSAPTTVAPSYLCWCVWWRSFRWSTPWWRCVWCSANPSRPTSPHCWRSSPGFLWSSAALRTPPIFLLLCL